MAQVDGRADLEARFVAEAERDEARVPVPAVAHRRLGDVRLFGAIGRSAGAAGRRVEEDFERRAGGRVGEVERVRSVDAGVVEDDTAVEAELGMVIETCAGEEEAFAGGEVGGRKGGAVEPEKIFETLPGADVVTEVERREVVRAGPVELHGAGDSGGYPVGGCRRRGGGGEAGELPGGSGEQTKGHGEEWPQRDAEGAKNQARVWKPCC